MNETIEYTTTSATGLMNHGWLGVMFFRDRTEQRSNFTKEDFKLAAQIKSGDYFVTLATKLDAMSRDISDYYVKTEIEDMVSDLIHLQDHYTITKREE